MEADMRIRALLLAAAMTIGSTLFAAAPASAMPVQSGMPTLASDGAVQQVAYYGGHSSEYRWMRRHGLHSPEYLWMRRHGLHSQSYLCKQYGDCGAYGVYRPYRQHRYYRDRY
jgi:hypothetical protein